MHSAARQLLGQWVVELVLRYFRDQKNAGGDKLFTKIAGIDDAEWDNVLGAFREAEGQLAAYYAPVLRTLKKVDGHELYQCREHETSTWLRNNTPSGSALLIFMNDSSPEAQSLENIFTIDEVRLLGAEGLDVLYHLFANKYRCFGDELKTLQQFLSLYGKLSEPQLRNVLEFLAAVIEDPQPSMVDRIQQHLDLLLLFRDSRLTFRGNEAFARLKRNYQLSRLEREGKTAKKEDFIENLYKFIEKATGPQDDHELWERVQPDVFRQQALDFIHSQSYELLQYEFDHIATALFFKVGKPKLNERVNDFRENVEAQGDWSPERDRLLSTTLESIDENRNPDIIQEFVNEFADELQEEPKLRKDLERIIVRQRQLPEYTELSDALLQESVLLLEEFAADAPPAEVNLKLSLDSKLGASAAAIVRFHLMQLERLTGYIRFDEDSISLAGDNDKETDVSFQLCLLAEGREAAKSKFKLVKAFDGSLPSMIDHLRDNERIPYIKSYYGGEMKLVDVANDVRERVSGYVATGQPGVREAADTFYAFVDFYTAALRRALEDGLCGMEFDQLEEHLEQLLGRIHQSVLISKHIVQFVGCLGAIDRFDCKMTELVGHAQSRTLTLLNPIRLLSYAKRIRHIGQELSNWIDNQRETPNTIDEMDAYLQQLKGESLRLSPHYFVVEGAQDQFLIEQQERMGEGAFSLNGKSSGEEQLVDTFAAEFLSTVKTYLDVYPYARDCLDIVFLYCPHAEYVTSAVDQIFKHTAVRKVKSVVHCERNGAEVYEQLNGWMNQEEYYSERHYSFPRVEVQVIAEQSINAMMQSVSHNLLDADIGVLINYFGQTSHIKYKLEKVAVKDSDNWFGTIYKEPLKRDDAVKRISFVSESLPKVMQYFYQMQSILHNNEAHERDEHYLLRNVISITRLSDTELINYMHDQFNWSLFIDRHLDKSLLRQVSSKAQIIKYKSKAGNNKNYRTLLSSSKYIRKLANELADHEYYDRLHQKYVLLLKNEHIDPQIVVQATERVKDISGGVVLRAIGPGKFAHEMMAMYLSTQVREAREGELVVWSVCDELPWFQGTVRRPDLVRTAIMRDGAGIRIHFELIELKFISHTIFETERYDAVKQVKAGLDLYRSRFLFREHPVSAEMWRKELIYYLLEYSTYSVEDALLLKELQALPIERIEVELSGSIDTFVYTSNLLDHSVMEGHVNGYQTDRLHNEFTNHIYNRAYILRALGAAQEDEVPAYETLQEQQAFVTSKLGLAEPEHEDEDAKFADSGHATAGNVASESTGADLAKDSPAEYGVTQIDEAAEREAARREATSLAYVAAGTETVSADRSTAAATGTAERPDSGKGVGMATNTAMSDAAQQGAIEAVALYHEQVALAGESRTVSPGAEDILPLIENYQRKLRFNFSQIGIPIKVVESFVGVSVIRMIVEIPGDKPYSSIENRVKDIYLWLQLTSIPLIALRNGRINIDINRETPETVYFEHFMEQIRAAFPPERLKGKLIAPIGIGQLRELITLDFSSSNTPHLLIGGTTGSGKSVTINSIILAMMCLYEPSEVQFLFIDPKKVEFLTYENRRHTKQVITEIEEAITALEQLVEEMELRYARFASESVMSIDEYVEVTGDPMPRLVVVFDEFADFMEREKALSGRVENAILRLGAKARAAGIHLMICTQNPKADIVPTNIRNNLPARLALKAADHHASKIIINEEGAEKLGGKGDFLIKLDLPEIVRAKSPFLTPRVKRALLQYFTKPEQL